MKRASVQETAKENEDSGLDRAGLPETESLTLQRSGQGSKTTEGRKGAPRAHADLDGENDVIRCVDTATHTPHTTGLDLQASEARRARVAWKVSARRQSRRDQARRRAPGMGIPVFAPARKPQQALRSPSSDCAGLISTDTLISGIHLDGKHDQHTWPRKKLGWFGCLSRVNWRPCPDCTTNALSTLLRVLIRAVAYRPPR